MKKILLSFLVIIAPFLATSQTIITGGFVSGPWTLSGSPYIITGDIQCGNLVIQAGVDVRFRGWGMTVYGSIKAIGTAAMPIIFEADDTTGWSNFSSPLGGTRGIYIPGNTTDTTIMDHCIIRDAKGLINDTYAVGLLIYTTHFTLKNSEVYHNYISGNGSIIRASLCSPVFQNNSIHDNIGRLCGGIDIESSHGAIVGNEIYNNIGSEGGAIFCVSLSDPTGPSILNNNIHNNRSTLDAGGIMIQDGPAILIGNNISFNHSARAGAGIYVMYAHAKIISNWICNNTDSIYPNCGINDGGGGILVNNAPGNDTAEIYNNIIANNNSTFRGGGIRVAGDGGTAWIENNHIINNTCTNGYFTGGMELSNNVHAHVRNNIIWGNRGYDSFGNMDSVQILAWANDTFALEYNCVEISTVGTVIINTNTLVTGNQASNVPLFGVNPGFVAATLGAGISYDATVADWHLVASSPCIDAGTIPFLTAPPAPFDIYNDPRILGTTIDIGAVEYPSQSGIQEHDKKSISVFPNPATDKIFIKDENPLTEIRITDVLGNVVLNLKYGEGIDVSALSEGIYFLSFNDENGNQIAQRFIKK